MIYERSIVVFASIVLSSLVASSGSTTESKNPKRNFVTEKIILSSANQIRAEDEILTAEGFNLQGGKQITEFGKMEYLQIASPVLNEQKILYLSSTKPTSTVVQAVQDPSAKIDQRLAVVGIGIISILFLILLWFLFKSEPKNIAKVTSVDKQG